MKIEEMVKIAGGRLLSGRPDVDVEPSKISIDSRAIAKGEFFIAIRGPNFYGGDFLEEAFKKGAVGAMVERDAKRLEGRKGIIIEVDDTTKALQDIARHHRMRFDIPVIAVTGSNGKTTVKEMISKTLSSRYSVLKSEGTRNNHIGVPLALLGLKDHHDICVLELGMNHRREIAVLSGVARQTMAVITNIGPSHLEFFKDLQDIFNSKREILEDMAPGSRVVLNGDDKFLSRIRDKRFDISRFGFGKGNDYRATSVSINRDSLQFVMNKRYAFELKVLGFHNIYNALAAIAVARSFGIDYKSIARALYAFRPSSMRLNLKKTSGISIIDDSYNSNPISMRCALEALKGYPARARWVVAGDMLELGKYERRFHEMLGSEISDAGVSGLLTFGRLSRRTFLQARISGMADGNLWHCSRHDDIVRILKNVVRKGDAVLVKGSRAMRMEKVVEGLEKSNFKV